MEQLQKHMPLVAAGLTGIGVCLFYLIIYPAHLHFTEQYQLFLFTQNYLLGLASYPGGVADIIGRFLTQFFYHTWSGALVMGLVAGASAAGCWRVARALGCRNVRMSMFCIVPPTAALMFMCDEFSLLSGVVATFGAMWVAVPFMRIGDWRIRLAAFAVATPVVYWLFGGAHAVFIVIMLISEYRRRQIMGLNFAALVVGGVVLFLLWPLVAYQFVHFPLYRLMLGVDFYRNPLEHPASLFVMMASACIVPAFCAFAPEKWLAKGKHSVVALAMTVAACCGLTAVASHASFEESMQYEYLAHKCEWNEILQMAQKSAPQHELSLVSINLALGMTGRLCDNLFDVYQTGQTGLVNKWRKDCTTALPLSELYYRLGDMNTALRYTTEAMEAIGDFQKSGRCMKRMAEINMINGHYDVARKYCRILENTIFYRKAAQQMLALMNNEKQLNAHHEYGHMRKLRHKTDIIINVHQFDVMMAQLVTDNNFNRMAFEYCMAWELLGKNLDRMVYFTSLGQRLNYREPPRAIQEALTLYNALQLQKTGKNAIEVPANMKMHFKNFSALARSNPYPTEEIKQRFGNTYWYYYFYREPKN